MINVEETIISQYDNSPTLKALITGFNDCVDPRADLDMFYSYVWDVMTAQGFGLDIWGRIVNVAREITYTGSVPTFGFDEAYTSIDQSAITGPQPFDQAPFFDGVQATQTYTLTDDAYRTLILVKALANISDATIQSLNTLLSNLFAGRGRCYVTDPGSMSMFYVFEFALQPYELAIITSAGVIPRPAGVLANVLQFDAANTFGFQEQGGQPFDNGVFLGDNGLSPVA